MLLSAATHLVVSASSNGIAGDAWNFEVQAEDNTNTVDATYSGTVHFTSGDGQAVLPGDSTLSSGGGFFNVTLKTSGVQSIVATDAANNAITGSTATHVFAAAATHLAVSEPATALVTKTFSFTVTALDAYANITPNFSDTLHFHSTDAAGVLPGDTSLPVGVGVGTFTAAFGSLGSQSIGVTDTFNPTIGGIGGTTDVQPLSTVVTNTNDSGDGSLRQAILNANTNPGADTITFNIPGNLPATIAPATPLPVMTGQTAVDGTTQPGYAGTPVVILDGVGAPSDAAGLVVDTTSADGSSIRGMEIVRFGGSGIAVDIADNVVIAGNVLGTDGTVPLANGTGGPNRGNIVLHIASNTQIGGTTASDRNVIAGGTGVLVGVDVVVNTVIEGNYFGTNAAGTAKIATGIDIVDAGIHTLIGGILPGAGNVVSGAVTGIFVQEVTGGAVIEGNFIGTNAAGDAAIGNTTGILVESASSVIGGASAAARNVVSGNATGISLGVGTGVTPVQNARVQGNYIGTNVAGTAAVPNDFGIVVAEISGGNQIGGINPGEGNLISANTTAGIDLDNGAGETVVYGNLIGTDMTGAAPLGNAIGVLVRNDSLSDLIGGSAPAEGNVIAYNTAAGVSIPHNASQDPSGIAIRLNSIFSNGGLGIDLKADGVTPNDAGDADNGPNDLQNFPLLVSATVDSGTVKLVGIINSNPSTTLLLDFYSSSAADPSGSGEGQTYIGTTAVTTDANGNASYNATFPSAVAAGQFVSATATTAAGAPYGDTSEFSPDVQAAAAPAGPAPTLSINDVSQTEGDSGTTAFTFTVTRTGDVSAGSAVDFATADGSANVANNDYAATSGVLTFAPFETSKTITVQAVGDTTVEPNETFSVNLSAPANASLAKAQGLGTIVNDDVAGTVQFSSATYSASETAGLATITVIRAGGSASGVTVHYATANGTGIAGTDYTSASGTLTFAAGEVSKTFPVTLLNDGPTAEPNETVNLTLTSPGGGGTLGTPSTAVLTILDPAPRITATGRNLAATKSKSFTGIVATFTDPDFTAANKFAATINWGDGSSSAGQIVWDSTNHVWDIIGAHLYKKKGTFPVLTTITDANGATATVKSTMAV